MCHLSFHSPVGDMTLFEENGAIFALEWGWACSQNPSPTLLQAKEYLDAYFDGEAQDHDLPLKPKGTPFQHRVWAALRHIPYGSSLTYSALATQVGSHARAIGSACGNNPIPILIPCHRVLGSNGALTGYSGEGGLETKAALLMLEGASFKHQPTFAMPGMTSSW